MTINSDVLESYNWDDDYVLTVADNATFAVYRITSMISILSSICILMETWADLRAGVGTTVTRILFSLQLGLIPAMVCYFIGSWAAPTHAESNALGARGTIATCEAVGFVLNFGNFVAIQWDIALSITYVLMIRYNTPVDKLKKMEYYFHGIIWSIGLAASIPPLFLDLYNENWEICGLDVSPHTCIDDGNCFRGDPEILPIFQAIVVFVSLLGIGISAFAMVSIYLYARKLEARNSIYSSGELSHNRSSNQEVSTRIAWQGIMYSGAILLSYLPSAIHLFIDIAFGMWSSWFSVFEVALRTLYGFFYLLVFLRQRPMDNMRTTYGRFIRRLVYCEGVSLYRIRASQENEGKGDEDKEETYRQQGRSISADL